MDSKRLIHWSGQLPEGIKRSEAMAIGVGSLIPLRYKGRDIIAVVIDPDGLGQGKPSIGIGVRGISKLMGVPRQTFQNRVAQIEGDKHLKLPSGNAYRVAQITAEDSNDYLLVEASDWVFLAADWLRNPGKLRQQTKESLINFLCWYAAEGIYAQAYTLIKRVYSSDDSQAIQGWLLSRETGKPYRAEWGAEVAEKDARKRFGILTNYIYEQLFGMKAEEMKAYWQAPVRGSGKIARNYIPEALGLEAVKYCEKMVAALDFDDIDEAHEVAVALTRRKYPELQVKL